RRPAATTRVRIGGAQRVGAQSRSGPGATAPLRELEYGGPRRNTLALARSRGGTALPVRSEGWGGLGGHNGAPHVYRLAATPSAVETAAGSPAAIRSAVCDDSPARTVSRRKR